MDLFETIAGTVWVSAIILVFIHQSLHVSTVWWGYINAAYLLGTLAGSLVCYHFATYFNQHFKSAISLGAAASTLVMLIITLNVIPIITLGCSLLFGLTTGIKREPQTTLIQKAVPREKLVTVYAFQNLCYTGTFSLATLTFSWLSDWAGIRTVFLIATGCLLIMTFLTRQLK